MLLHACICSWIIETISLLSVVDLDECETGTHDCAVEAACVNNEGSFSCECPNGYAGDGRKCSNNKRMFSFFFCDR